MSPLALLAGVSCCSGQKKRRKDKKKASPTEPAGAIDKSYLCCEHHKAMVAGLCLLGGPDALPGDKAGSRTLCWGQVSPHHSPLGKGSFGQGALCTFPKAVWGRWVGRAVRLWHPGGSLAALDWQES